MATKQLRGRSMNDVWEGQEAKDNVSRSLVVVRILDDEVFGSLGADVFDVPVIG